MSILLFLSNLIQYIDFFVGDVYNGEKGGMEMEIRALEDLVVLRVFSVNTIFTSESTTVSRKKREKAALLIKWEGETEYFCNGIRILSNVTHPVFLPKGSSYEWKCIRSGHYTIVEFDTDQVCDEIVGFSVADGERLHRRLRELELAGMRNQPYWQLRAVGEVSSMLFSLLGEGNSESTYLPTKKSDKLKPAVEYMTAHYNQEISNEQLAGMCGISTVYFRKLFTAAYGVSRMRYLGRLRIQRAKEMLQSDYGTLYGVAASVGFPNVFHFSKMFRAEVGIAPGTYAKKK